MEKESDFQVFLFHLPNFSTFIIPIIIFNKVDLPVPLGPVKAIISPLETFKLIFLSTLISLFCWKYEWEILFKFKISRLHVVHVLYIHTCVLKCIDTGYNMYVRVYVATYVCEASINVWICIPYMHNNILEHCPISERNIWSLQLRM